jgi:hypothetical protein
VPQRKGASRDTVPVLAIDLSERDQSTKGEGPVRRELPESAVRLDRGDCQVICQLRDDAARKAAVLAQLNTLAAHDRMRRGQVAEYQDRLELVRPRAPGAPQRRPSNVARWNQMDGRRLADEAGRRGASRMIQMGMMLLACSVRPHACERAQSGAVVSGERERERERELFCRKPGGKTKWTGDGRAEHEIAENTVGAMW